MPDSVPSGQDLVPKRVWATIGGRAAEAEKKEFKDASRKAKNELKAAKKAYKDKYGGGLAAWKKTEGEQRKQ